MASRVTGSSCIHAHGPHTWPPACNELKGHISHIITEVEATTSGPIGKAVKSVIDTVLSKQTLRCSDYRKANLLILHAIKETDTCSNKLLQLFQSLVEIQEILYSKEEHRNDRSILRLYNLTYIHARLCIELFPNPKTITRRKMFGIYFHSITCHTPEVYRLVCLRSLNTENQERLFGQAKQITKGQHKTAKLILAREWKIL